MLIRTGSRSGSGWPRGSLRRMLKSHRRRMKDIAKSLTISSPPRLGTCNSPNSRRCISRLLTTAGPTGGRRDGKPGGLSPMTRRHIHRVLSAAVSRTVEQQLIARNPAEVFRKRHGPRRARYARPAPALLRGAVEHPFDRRSRHHDPLAKADDRDLAALHRVVSAVASDAEGGVT